MEDYSYLFSQLRYWQNEVGRLQKELRKWKKRKQDVEGVQKTLRSVAQNSAGDVNSKLSKADDKLDHAIDCPAKENRMDSIFKGKSERNVDGDPDLSSAKGAISQEINVCKGKITELEGDLRNAENQVRQTQNIIRNLEKD